MSNTLHVTEHCGRIKSHWSSFRLLIDEVKDHFDKNLFREEPLLNCAELDLVMVFIQHLPHSLRDSHVEDLVQNAAIFRSGALEKWLHQEVSVVPSELKQYYTKILMTLLQDGGDLGCRSLGTLSKVVFCPWALTVSVALFPGHNSMSIFPLPHLLIWNYSSPQA